MSQEQFPPGGCAPTELGSIQLKTAEGYLVDSYFTGSEGRCELSGAIASTSYIFEFVGGSIPSGYVARDNPNLFTMNERFNTGVVFLPESESDASTDFATGHTVRSGITGDDGNLTLGELASGI